MSYGIPSLYIASKSSELNNYAIKYKHAQCFEKNELDRIAFFINKLKTDKIFYMEMSKNAEEASENFKRDNADIFIKLYMK